MILWTWQTEDQRWRPQAVAAGAELPLGDAARLWTAQDGGALLFAQPSVTVNGRSALPLNVIEDRDEIRVGSTTWCLSFDSAPIRERFHDAGQAIHCARCQGPLADGEATILCPQCHARYHDGELRCWTYVSTCGRCRRSTAQRVWQPDPLIRTTRTLRHDGTTTR